MVLTGGDLAKRPHFVELIEHGTKEGLAMAVTPSGTPLMTRERLVEMGDAGMARLAVSVDGPTRCGTLRPMVASSMPWAQWGRGSTASSPH